jgi:hypothetical protein
MARRDGPPNSRNRRIQENIVSGRITALFAALAVVGIAVWLGVSATKSSPLE